MTAPPPSYRIARLLIILVTAGVAAALFVGPIHDGLAALDLWIDAVTRWADRKNPL